MPVNFESNVQTALREVVASFGDLYVTDGILKKDAIITDLDKHNVELVGQLLSNAILKEAFTERIAGTSILKINEIIQMLETDEYWSNSYTSYINKIGLSSHGRFIDDSDDVVLDFPYKDTILKAGMSKEDVQKDEANESFLNEIVAREEIDVLLDNKIFKNALRYDENGSSEVSKFKDSDNLVIKGNNLLALHSLKSRYAGRVKLIYIDVPYYFKKNKENDAFSYNSNFKLSTWLTFLKNRIEIAYYLLSDTGSIWIHTGEEGMHYLKVIADSVIGANKFVGTLPRKTRDGKSDVPFNFSQDFDWILVYTKGSEGDDIVGRSVSRKYYESDDFPNRPWRTADLTKQTTIYERPNSNFTMVNPKTGKEYPVNPKRSWAVTKDTFNEWYQKGGIGFPDDYDFMKGNKPFRRVFKDEDEKKRKLSYVSSDLLLKDFISNLLAKSKNNKGNDEITELFSRDAFSYAKPESLLKSILEICTKQGDLVLDFFMGSATTQAVAHKMNRQYIGIEQMDYIQTVSVERLKKVIAGEQGGISKDVNWQGGGSFIYAELMDKNTTFINAVLAAQTVAELQTVFNDMKNTLDFDFRVDLREVSQSLWDEELEVQKKILVQIIDKNQLYHNYSEIEDETVKSQLADSDIAFNKSFYGE